MGTANMLLSVFFVSGVFSACTRDSGLFITAPKRMEALSGSCLQIPCSFRVASGQTYNIRRKTFGVWMKNHTRQNNVIFNSSRTDNVYPGRITGNLRERNCTTVFSSLLTSYSGTYYFRVENSPFRATAVCNPVPITVRDSPARPRIEISGDLKEEEPVTITCSAFIPCPHSPPKLTWNLQQDPHTNMEEHTDGTFTTKIQETITLSDQHDGYNISCSATYPVNEGQEKTAGETKTLSVSYAPKNTKVSISPSGLVSAGSWVNLSCSSRAKPPVSRFTWFKSSEDGLVNVSEGPFYSFNVTRGGVYYCVATNDLGQQTSAQIDLNIEELSVGSQQWKFILGGITALIGVTCLVVFVWHFKSTRPPPQHTQVMFLQSQTEEDIHYGEIDFKRRPERRPDSVQDSGQQQDTLYAHIKVPKPANTLTVGKQENEMSFVVTSQ